MAFNKFKFWKNISLPEDYGNFGVRDIKIFLTLSDRDIIIKLYKSVENFQKIIISFIDEIKQLAVSKNNLIYSFDKIRDLEIKQGKFAKGKLKELLKKDFQDFIKKLSILQESIKKLKLITSDIKTLSNKNKSSILPKLNELMSKAESEIKSCLDTLKFIGLDSN